MGIRIISVTEIFVPIPIIFGLHLFCPISNILILMPLFGNAQKRLCLISRKKHNKVRSFNRCVAGAARVGVWVLRYTHATYFKRKKKTFLF